MTTHVDGGANANVFTERDVLKDMHKPIFNMAELESITDLPAITPAEHESYQM